MDENLVVNLNVNLVLSLNVNLALNSNQDLNEDLHLDLIQTAVIGYLQESNRYVYSSSCYWVTFF